MPIDRISSRTTDLGPHLAQRLHGARRYLRIAGYFRSSLLDVVGEALETVEEIRVVCNGELDPNDVAIAKAARDGAAALSRALAAAWQSTEEGAEILFTRDRYRRLHTLLASGRMRVRVVPRDAGRVFVHGKAGVIEAADGRAYSFVGSVNDSVSGFRHAYEILWGDDDPAAADWVRGEFEHFWAQGVDLPDMVVRHIGAMAARTEYRSIADARGPGGEVAPAAVLAERPIYKGGAILRSWQKRFVQTCVEDWRAHGSARFLIADDVGLGKTLSMAAAALVLSLLDDAPVLILAPATLLWQWQDELDDKLGIPAAVWSTQKKCWLDVKRRPLTQRGDPSLIAKCPWRIGIVSTGLVVNGSDAAERGFLARKAFGVVILDEAHKARVSRGMNGTDDPKPNNLMAFLRRIAGGARHVILGTATPIQLDPIELWDLLDALGQGAPHVLGKPAGGAEWLRPDAIKYLTGATPWPEKDASRWALFRNPLPPAAEAPLFRDIRSDANLAASEVLGPRFDDVSRDARATFIQDFTRLAETANPVIRRVIRRTRPMLEAAGLLKPIAVVAHPRADDGLPANLFDGEGLQMSFAFQAAYEAAEHFSRLYAARCPGAGFLKTILLRRIGSSALAGLETARHLLDRLELALPLDGETDDEPPPSALEPPSSEEIQLLREVERNLDSVIAGADIDPKIQTVLFYMRDRRWLRDNGGILFSQYLTTAKWALDALCAAYPDEFIALYAGGSESCVQRGQERRLADRDTIKKRVADGTIRLVCATDAACEGLNLQRLGAQVNLDMPWNPSRLEQRKGRVQRIGQVRDRVHVLNLRYAGTVEDIVYTRLSERFGDIFAVLGQLPDSFEADWIDNVLRDRAAVQFFSQRQLEARPPMDVRYARDIAHDTGLDWEFTEKVLSSRDLDDWMRQGW